MDLELPKAKKKASPHRENRDRVALDKEWREVFGHGFKKNKKIKKS